MIYSSCVDKYGIAVRYISPKRLNVFILHYKLNDVASVQSNLFTNIFNSRSTLNFTSVMPNFPGLLSALINHIPLMYRI